AGIHRHREQEGPPNVGPEVTGDGRRTKRRHEFLEGSNRNPRDELLTRLTGILHGFQRAIEMLDPGGTAGIDLREHVLHEGRTDAIRKRSVSERYGYIADKTGRIGRVDGRGRRRLVR